MRGKIRSIRWKMMGYFLIVVMIMAVCLFAFYQISMDNITGMAVESMENVLAKINLDTYNTLHEAQEIAYLVAKDSEIQSALRSDLPQETRELYQQRMNFSSKLWYMNRYTKDLNGIYVVGENGVLFRSANRSMLIQDFREDDWYQQIKEMEEPLWTCQETGSFMIRDLDEYMISIMVPIIDRASYRFMGVAIVDVLMDNLKQISQEGMVFDGMLMLLDEQNDVLYSDCEEKLDEDEMACLEKILAEGALEDQETKGLSVDGRGFLVSSMPLDIAGWKIVGMVSYDVLYKEINAIRSLLLLVSAICICLSVTMAISASNGISKPILAIRSVMRKVERGDLEAHADIARNDEVGELADSFNHMVDKLNILVKNQKESQEKLRMAELNALQAQINPHFLYNTLDSINWLARAGQTEQVSEMVNSLSAFFRISLSKGKTFITVDEELRHVENYILIQKRRYEKYLDYVIEVPEQIRGCQCLKMILQPLVENSIYHGIKEKGKRGLIRISAEERPGVIALRVADTGQGMTEDKMKELQEMMQKDMEYDANAYGVINVQRRIQTYFGKGYGLHFQSTWGEGTEVTVVIPKRGIQEGRNELESSNRRG